MTMERGSTSDRAGAFEAVGVCQIACASVKSIPCFALFAADFAGSNSRQGIENCTERYEPVQRASRVFWLCVEQRPPPPRELVGQPLMRSLAWRRRVRVGLADEHGSATDAISDG